MHKETLDRIALTALEYTGTGRRKKVVRCNYCKGLVIGVAAFRKHLPNCPGRSKPKPIRGGQVLTENEVKAILGPIA